MIKIEVVVQQALEAGSEAEAEVEQALQAESEAEVEQALEAESEAGFELESAPRSVRGRGRWCTLQGVRPYRSGTQRVERCVYCESIALAACNNSQACVTLFI